MLGEPQQQGCWESSEHTTRIVRRRLAPRSFQRYREARLRGGKGRGQVPVRWAGRGGAGLGYPHPAPPSARAPRCAIPQPVKPDPAASTWPPPLAFCPRLLLPPQIPKRFLRRSSQRPDPPSCLGERGLGGSEKGEGRKKGAEGPLAAPLMGGPLTCDCREQARQPQRRRWFPGSVSRSEEDWEGIVREVEGNQEHQVSESQGK